MKGAQKDQDNLSGWREMVGNREQYVKKGQEEGNPKVSSGDSETNLGEWKSRDRVVVGDKNVRAALSQILRIFKYQTFLGGETRLG